MYKSNSSAKFDYCCETWYGNKINTHVHAYVYVDEYFMYNYNNTQCSTWTNSVIFDTIHLQHVASWKYVLSKSVTE